MKTYKFIILILSQWFIYYIKVGACTCSNSYCQVLTATNTYGKIRTGNCFQVLVSSLKQIIVHKETNIVGLTFNFFNGTSSSFIEKSSITKSYSINLANATVNGVNLKIGTGVESLQFLLTSSSSNNASLTEMMGNSSSGCLVYLNSSFLNVPCFEINTLYGCVDDKNSSYFPYIAFSYYFSHCTSATETTSKTTTLTTQTGSSNGITIITVMQSSTPSSTVKTATITASTIKTSTVSSSTVTASTTLTLLSTTTGKLSWIFFFAQKLIFNIIFLVLLILEILIKVFLSQ